MCETLIAGMARRGKESLVTLGVCIAASADDIRRVRVREILLLTFAERHFSPKLARLLMMCGADATHFKPDGLTCMEEVIRAEMIDVLTHMFVFPTVNKRCNPYIPYSAQCAECCFVTMQNHFSKVCQ